jgi:hypothetical protein
LDIYVRRGKELNEDGYGASIDELLPVFICGL